jgi:hypothetical protein
LITATDLEEVRTNAILRLVIRKGDVWSASGDFFRALVMIFQFAARGMAERNASVAKHEQMKAIRTDRARYVA